MPKATAGTSKLSRATSFPASMRGSSMTSRRGIALGWRDDGRVASARLLGGRAVLQDRAGSTSISPTDGWFRTGDVVTIDADGFMTITDRTKDLVKSGGEWISSVDVENMLISHPDVFWKRR